MTLYYSTNVTPPFIHTIVSSSSGLTRVKLSTTYAANSQIEIAKIPSVSRISSLKIMFTSGATPKSKIALGIMDIETKNLILKDYLVALDPTVAQSPLAAAIDPEVPYDLLKLSTTTKALNTNQGAYNAHPSIQNLDSIAAWLTTNSLLTVSNSTLELDVFNGNRSSTDYYYLFMIPEGNVTATTSAPFEIVIKYSFS